MDEEASQRREEFKEQLTLGLVQALGRVRTRNKRFRNNINVLLLLKFVKRCRRELRSVEAGGDNKQRGLGILRRQCKKRKGFLSLGQQMLW